MDRSSSWKKTPDLEKGSLFPLILRYSLPAIFAYFISELYNMVDTYFVGNYVSANAIGALGTVFPVQRLVIALSLLFSFATINRLAFHLGEKDKLAAERSINSGITLNFVVMLPYTLLIFLLRRQIMPILGARSDLFAPAVEYVSIVIWGSIFLTLSTTLSRILLTYGHASLSVWLNSIGALINIVLDLVFVKYLHWGIRGAAWATILSQMICFVITLIFYIKVMREKDVKFSFYASASSFATLFKTGFPSFIVEAEDAFVMPVLNFLLFTIAGTAGVNVMAINTKVYMFLFVIILGFAYGMQTIVAYNYGAGNIKRIKKTVRLTAIISLLTALIFTTIIYFNAASLFGIFVTNSDLIALSLPTFRRMIVGLPILSLYYISVMFFQAMAYERASIILTFLRQILILIPLALIAVYLFKVDLNGLYLVYPITDIIATIIAVSALKKTLKQL